MTTGATVKPCHPSGWRASVAASNRPWICWPRRYGTARTNCGKRACGRFRPQAPISSSSRPDWSPVTDPAQRSALIRAMGRAAVDSLERRVARTRSLRLRPERRIRPVGSTPAVHRAPALARPSDHARGLVAIRDARVHRLLPPAGTRHAGRHDGRAGGDTAAGGSPLRRPAARVDHHEPRGSHDRARVADPAIHHCRWECARHLGRREEASAPGSADQEAAYHPSGSQARASVQPPSPSGGATPRRGR